MGCHVNLASAHTRPKSAAIRIVSTLSLGKGIVFSILSLIFPEGMVLLLGVGIIEIIISRWIWSLRIESWGVAVGFSIFHILFPLSLPVSTIGFWIIVGLSMLEIAFLAQARLKGYYSFVMLAKMDPPDSFQITGIQRRMFNLVTIAQLMKTLGMFLGAYAVYSYEATVEPLYWYGVPQVPLVLLLAIIDLVATVGFHYSKDWAFQLVLVLAGLGFAETMLAWSVPVMLLAIWIVTLLGPCWAKWGFYQGLHRRVHAGLLTATENHDKPGHLFNGHRIKDHFCRCLYSPRRN
ncbi:MAG: hypothetical protein P1Q69_06680 [Candidatus Thorarchaeota archaeon]|nr:hypothetical protein [Candidatus Thorarchaeota archaeon]